MSNGLLTPLRLLIRLGNLLALASLSAPALHLPSFWIFHGLVTAATLCLAAQLRRSVPGWTLGALLLPLVVSTWLSFRPANRPGCMTAGDTCWYNMEREVNHMMVVGVLFFETAPTPHALHQLLQERLLAFDRFRQVPQPDAEGYLHWQDDPDFRLEQHVVYRPLPEATAAAFQQRMDALSSQKLDFSKPLWAMEVVENHPEGAAVIVRLHHCIADGIALVRVLLSLTDAEEQAASPASEASLSPVKRRKLNPLRLLGEMLAALPRMLMLPDSHTSFKNALSGDRVVGWSQPLPLARIKALAHAHDGKINDLVLAAIAGALRRYFQQRQEPVDGITFRVLVPVNVRPLDGPIVLGNQVGFIYLPLPVGVADPIERLRLVKETMDRVKRGKEALVAYLSLSLMGTLPQGVQHALIDNFNNNASSTMTNVPGPRQPLRFAGQTIRNMVFFGPQSGKMGVGLSVFSYCDTLTMGISADRAMVPHPEQFTACFVDELAEWPER